MLTTKQAGHQWAVACKAFADRPTPPYGDLGQWSLLAWKMTGEERYARDAISRGLAAFPHVPPDRNFTREHSITLAQHYIALKDQMTDEQRSQWESRMQYWALAMLGLTDEAGMSTRVGDSDECVGHYMGLRLIDRALGTDHCSKTGLPRSDDAKAMRQGIRDFIGRATGGEWIENGQKYNWGTLQLLLMGYATIGPEEFPEITEWLPSLAEEMVWVHTADGKDLAQWGDVEDPHHAGLYEFVSLASIVIGLGGDKTGDLKQLLAASIDGRSTDDYWFTLYRAVSHFDPRTLPATFQRPNPQGLRSTGVGMVLYRKGGTLVQLNLPNQVLVDHQMDGCNLRIYDGGEWIVDSPLGYGAGPTNRVLGFGHPSMGERMNLVGTAETADGFTAAWTTGGNLRGPWASWHPPVFVDEMTTTITYRHSDRSLTTVDTFKGAKPDARPMKDGGQFYPTELAPILAAPAAWQRIQHAPTEPTATADGFTWKTKSGRTISLTSTAARRKEKVVNRVNVNGNFHDQELAGWLMRLTSDALPTAEMTTTIRPGEVVHEPTKPTVIRAGNKTITDYPDRVEILEVIPKPNVP